MATAIAIMGARVALGLILCLGGIAPAAAQTGFPSRPVTIVVNFTPGGPLDIIARSVAQDMAAALGQPFVVDNRAGAGGAIGANVVAKGAADGHTILFSIDTPFTVGPSLDPKPPFVLADFKPLVLLAVSGLALGTHPSLGITTAPQFIAKGRSGDMTFASGGNGSPGHLAAAILREKAGIKTIHVPYKGNAQAVGAVVAGEVNAGVLATPGMLPHMQANRIVPVLVTSRVRSALLPQVPTAAEAGLPDVEIEVSYVAMVPAATPEPVVQRLTAALLAAMAKPELQSRLAQLDLHPTQDTGSAVATHLDATRERYAGPIKAAGMKAD